ncbi:MAG: hypothetical protein A2Y97_09780 [Nitrospirae bacterium RBG_13_39_12]|nr:MAG: hypothetical protein A2Y97_09780 [Nitrospirae bacterium RBG_13_39_12]
MIESIPFLISGIIFGLAAGISPGPLLTLVISETLKHNKKEGIKVAIVPVLTDLPVVFISVFILAKLSSSNLILGTISILGALFIGYLAYESIFVKGMELNLQEVKPQSLRKGVITNFLNPHPYLFWIVVGAPTVIKAHSVSLQSVLLFIIGFYLFLVGSKVTVALLVDRTRGFLKSNAYFYTIRLLGIILLIFAGLFVKDGLKFFGLI